MKIHIPSPLASYTLEQRLVASRGGTVAEMLGDLEARFPGIRFRMIDEQDAIRRHIRIFINGELSETINSPLSENDEVHIICALSGG